MKKITKRTVVILQLVIVVLLAALLVTVIILNFVKNDNGEMKETDNTGIDIETNVPPEVKMLEFENQYCVLKFPGEWEDSLVHSSTVNGDVVHEKFSCGFEDINYDLFDIYFGDATVGDLVGYIAQGEDLIAVTMTSSDFVPNLDWTDEDSDRYLSMKSCLNDVLLSITEAEGFTEH